MQFATQPMNNSRISRCLTILPLLLYILLGMAVLGPVLKHPYTSFIGGTGDPQQFMWYLGWFWYAVSHGLNPFYTNLLNAPVGQNSMWNTSILAESLLFGPLTWLWNTTFTYNLLWLANFVASCWLGQKIVSRFGVRPWLAVVGGLLMGTLPYSTAQTLFHIHLWTTCVVLAMLYLLIVAHQSEIHRPIRFGILFGCLAAFEFYTSLEVFATMTMVAVILLILGFIVAPRSLIAGVTPTRIKALSVAAVVVAAFALPGIYEMFHDIGHPRGALLPLGLYVNDLFNFFVPLPVYWLHNAHTTAITSHYTGNWWEDNGYIGVPAVLLLLYSIVRLWKHSIARTAIYAFLIIALLSMGPVLHVNGQIRHLVLPWIFLQHVPLIESALPSRIMFFGDILLVMLLIPAVEMSLRHRRPGRFFSAGIVPVILLCAVLITWLPQIPYPHSTTPKAADSLAPGSPVYDQIQGRNTYALVDTTPDLMQSIAQGGYAMAMVNPYGYTGNSPQRRDTLWQVVNIYKPNLSQADVENILASTMPGLGVDRILYFPMLSKEHLKPVIYNALTDLYGPPRAKDHGAVVWAVKP